MRSLETPAKGVVGRRRVVVVAASLVGAIALSVALPAARLDAAAAPRCFNLKATKVGTPKADVLRGTPSLDVIVGLGGNDVIRGLGADDILCGGPGNDRLIGGGGRDAISADAGSDVIKGGAARDLLSAGAGDDEIDGGSDPDSLTYIVSPSAVIVNMQSGTATGEGNDQFTAVNGIFGSSFDDDIQGSEEADLIYGYGGNDTISGGNGDDVIGGEDGNDNLDGGPGLDFLDFFFSPEGVEADLGAGTATGEGTDQFIGFERAQGSEHDDILRGSAATDVLFGNAGNDQLDGAGGDLDFLDGGAGNDSLDGGDGLSDVAFYLGSNQGMDINLEAGTATGAGNDSLTRIESVVGSDFNDRVVGNQEINMVIPWLGNDTFDGAGGNDVVIAFLAPTVKVDLQAGTMIGEGNDTLIGVEGVLGTAGADELKGSSGADLLAGGAGNDVILGLAGDDILTGNLGDDTLDGGPGAYDMLDFFGVVAPLRVDLTAGTATGDGTDTLIGIEGVSGGDGNDELIGDAQRNFLLGWLGDDILRAGSGDDFLAGGLGSDSADAGDGVDNCTDIETFLLASTCEGTQQVPAHPMSGLLRVVQEFSKRNNM